MMIRLTTRQVSFLRMKAQHLLSGQDTNGIRPAGILREMGGAQAQDLPSALLSIRARSQGLTAEEVERVRNLSPDNPDRDRIAWIWCMRGTLHLVPARDALWLVPLMGADFIRGNARRFADLGWDEDTYRQGIAVVRAALEKEESLMRREIVQLFSDLGLPAEGQAPVHFLFRAVFEGKLCLVADKNQQPGYGLFAGWLGKTENLSRDEGLRRLAEGYLNAFGPATPDDLAYWAGIRGSDAAQGWKLITDQLAEVEIAGRAAWMMKRNLGWIDEIESISGIVRLLPRYDTLWMGYARRDWLIDADFGKRVQPGGGQISAMVLVDGQVSGTWKTRRKGELLLIDIAPFRPLDEWLQQGIGKEVAAIGAFLGKPVVIGALG
jgi:hypothetical protein